MSFVRQSTAYVLRNIHYARPPEWRAGIRALYRRLNRSGIFVFKDEVLMCSLRPEKILAEVLGIFKPRSILDVGCGTGQALNFFKEHGVEALGIEGSRVARMNSQYPSCILTADLRKPIDLGRQFDLCWSFEVAEHIHPLYAETFIQTLVRHAPIIVMSAAPPGQGGLGHFNEQPKGYWANQFSKFGYAVDAVATDRLVATNEFYSQNMMAFVKGGVLPLGNAQRS
jgi:SAM-dependent methyltransferase